MFVVGGVQQPAVLLCSLLQAESVLDERVLCKIGSCLQRLTLFLIISSKRSPSWPHSRA